jgi:DNA repair exonuclease SbcCD nuclease subunit
MHPTTHKKSAEVAGEISRHVEFAREDLEAMVQEVQGRMPKRLPAPRPKPTGILLELMVPDLHLGKLAWGEETGYSNYDSKEAVRRYKEAIATLVARTAHAKPEHIALILGNDLFHSDNKAGTTTKGTPLDNDSRFAKMFREGRQMLTDVITELHTVAPVTALVVPGNHDAQAAWTVGEALECWFRNTPTVTIENRPTPRKYFEWGTTMLGFEHGDKEKADKRPLSMATEQPEMWGRTTFREIHCGHIHSLQTHEYKGVVVRSFGALCAVDAWHSDFGYINAMRRAEALLWSKHEGQIGGAIYTVGA